MLFFLSFESSFSSHFCFGRYLDNLLESRIMAFASQMNHQSKIQKMTKNDDHMRKTIISNDQNCQKYVLMAIEEYLNALSLGQKHIFQALPRLLTLWFDFTSIEVEEDIKNSNDDLAKETKIKSQKLLDSQFEANKIVHSFFKNIPAVSFYTAMPQLISNLWHMDSNTSGLVANILKRVLTKFPSQAMWSLGYLRHSMYKNRRDIGEKIFQGAEGNLRRNEQMKMHDILVESKSLFLFLINLAK